MVDKTAVAELIAYEVPVVQVAQAFGVSSQYIHNLVREDEELQSILQEKAAEIAVRSHNSKVSVEVIKHDLLDKIRAQIPLSDSLIESVKALQTVVDIEGKQRAIAHGNGSEGAKAGVLDLNLNLPDGATIQIQKNGNNEIINIAGRNMAPMPAGKVIEAVKERKDNGRETTGGTGEQHSDEHKAAVSLEYSPNADSL